MVWDVSSTIQAEPLDIQKGTNTYILICRYKPPSGIIGTLYISTHTHYVGCSVPVEHCQLEESVGPVQINEEVEAQTKHVSH